MAAEQIREATSLDDPDETRPFVHKGRVDIVNLGAVTVGRGVVGPGWRVRELPVSPRGVRHASPG